MIHGGSMESLDISKISAAQAKDVVAGSNASVAAILRNINVGHVEEAPSQVSYNPDSFHSASSVISSPPTAVDTPHSREPAKQPSPSTPRNDSTPSTAPNTTALPSSATYSSASPNATTTVTKTTSSPVSCQPVSEGREAHLCAQVEQLKKEVEELKEENYMWSMKAAKDERTALRLSISQLKFDDAVQVCTREEFDALKKDIVQQESLIAAYQRENEKLTLEVKELRKQLNETKDAMYAAMVKKPAAMQEGTQASSVQTREWKLKHDRLAKEVEVREGEWQAEFEALKRQKKELEARLNGFDWEKMCNDELEIRRLTAELKRREVNHQNQVDALESQIRWYVENQEMVTKNDELMAAQAQTIDNLRQRVLELEGTSKDAGRGEAGLKTRYYQKRISELEEALRRAERGQKDDDIPALIRAVKPSMEETQHQKFLQKKVQQLQQELDDQTAKSEKALRVLRLESDRLKASYETRISQMEDDMKMRIRAATSKKVQELTRQLDEARTYYSKKVRELEAQVVSLRRDLKGQGRGVAPAAGRAKPLAPLASTDIASAASPGRADDGAIAITHRSQGTQVDNLSGFAGNTGTGEQAPGLEYAVHLQSENRRLQDEVSRLARLLAGNLPVGAHASNDVEVLHQRLGAAQAEAAAQRQIAARAQEVLHRAQLEQTERLHSMLQEQQQARDQLIQQHRKELEAVAVEYQAELQAVQERQQMVAGLGAGLEGDRVAYLQCVAARLEALEQHCWLREREVQRTLEETKRMADFELQVEKQKLQLLLQVKNNEIERFRMELDALMEQLTSLAQDQASKG
eukprot:GGOE01001064.1.p1 GENE.GGOE01001064.1~~GGOE01001064.1.p1  ORF type:complete len:809 (-),score=239.76 GGOE01001064.1:174-2600(-)